MEKTTAKAQYQGSYCAAVNCSNSSRSRPDLSFFRFPIDRAKRWAINVRRMDLTMKSPEYMNKNCKVCSEHFESIMFLNDLKNRLQPTAVPTIVNVANPPQRVTSKRPRPVNRSHPGIGSSDSRTKTRKLAEECTSAQPTSTPATDCMMPRARRPTKASVPQAQPVANHSSAQKLQNDVRFHGQVRYTMVDGVCIPSIIRDGKLHCPVRTLEDKLLNRLASTDVVNAAFQHRQLLISKYLTDVEALQLTYFAGKRFGAFTSDDLVVDVDEFNELYAIVKSELQSTTTPVTGGWLQVNNSVIPYVNIRGRKFLPLPVVTNAAGLLCSATATLMRLNRPTEAQCRYLTDLCSSAGLEFTFDTTTPLVDMAVMCALTNPKPYTHELPTDSPFSHAQFIDEPVLTSAPDVQSWRASNGVAARDVVAGITSGLVRPDAADHLSTVQSSQVTQPLNVSNSQQCWPAAHTVIESLPFRGRTISSLRRPADDNQYVLLDAVCRVFFPHQSNVDGFMRAVETLFHVPALNMTSAEEREFISFYKLPTERLKHTQLIRLDLLNDIFPHLELMFSAKVGEGVIGTVIPRCAGDSLTTQTNTTTTTTNNNNNNDDDDKDDVTTTRPSRKRRRNDVCSEVVVID